jgi:hypothetical protein
MREIVTTTAAEAGRATRFVQRPSPRSGATFRPTFGFGFLGHPQATLEARTQTAAALGVELSPPALEPTFYGGGGLAAPGPLDRHRPGAHG